MDAIEEIKQLYSHTSAKTIQDDFARAIDLLKALPDAEARERAAVYMEGLAEMRREWGGRGDAGGASRGGSGGGRGRAPGGKPAAHGPKAPRRG